MSASSRLSRSDLEQILGLIGELGEADDVPSLRGRIMAGIRELVEPDGVGYTEIEMKTGEAGFWSDPGEVAGLADTEAFEALLHQHPVAGYHQRNGGNHAVQLDDFLTRRELHRLELYHDFYRPLEIEHQLAIAVVAPGPVSIPISVHRSRRGFSERERAALGLLHPHLEQAHRRLASQLAARRMLEAVGEAQGTAVISLGSGDRIELASGPALAWLTTYFDPSGAASDRLPRELTTWLEGARGRGGEERIQSAPEALLVDGPGSQLLVRYLRARSRWEDDLLLLEERRVRPDPAELRERGLTPREAEVLVCAADGRTDAEIALELAISVRTVHKHLESSYRKLGVVTRTAAIAAALERPRA